MKNYVILIKGSFAKWNALTEDQRTGFQKQFGEYAQELGKLNYMRGGDGCSERSFRIKDLNKSDEQCLLPTSTEDMVTGYFMIEVPSEEEALRMARKCPAFQCDEYVELIPCG